MQQEPLGLAYSECSDADREAIVAAYPRTEHCKEDIIQTFYDGIKHKPETTFGNVKADVLADKDPKFQRMNFCSVIRGSQWKGEDIPQRVLSGTPAAFQFNLLTVPYRTSETHVQGVVTPYAEFLRKPL